MKEEHDQCALSQVTASRVDTLIVVERDQWNAINGIKGFLLGTSVSSLLLLMGYILKGR